MTHFLGTIWISTHVSEKVPSCKALLEWWKFCIFPLSFLNACKFLPVFGITYIIALPMNWWTQFICFFESWKHQVHHHYINITLHRCNKCRQLGTTTIIFEPKIFKKKLHESCDEWHNGFQEYKLPTSATWAKKVFTPWLKPFPTDPISMTYAKSANNKLLKKHLSKYKWWKFQLNYKICNHLIQ